MTPLKRWLKGKGYTNLWLQKELQLSQGYVSRIVSGKVTINNRLAHMIQRVTDGEVRAEDLTA